MSDERRKEAEALFMELRNSKLPYGVCKFALGGLIAIVFGGGTHLEWTQSRNHTLKIDDHILYYYHANTEH